MERRIDDEKSNFPIFGTYHVPVPVCLRKSEAVKETEQAIKAIGKVTMSSQDAIEEASNLFDALTSEEQAKVSNRNDLSKAKDEFQSLVDYYIEIADRIVSAYTPQLGGAYKFTGEYLEDEKTYVVMMSADEAQIDEIVKDKPYSDMIKQLSMKQLDENTEEISAELFLLMEQITTAFGPEDSGITRQLVILIGMVIQRDIIKRLENQNYAEKKKTWDIIGALLGLVILIVGVIFCDSSARVI